MTDLILASGSSIRRKMLEDAGVEFDVVPANIDEDAAKEGKPDIEAIAQSLAEAKALAVSRLVRSWVLGSDSIVTVGGQLFSKPGIVMRQRNTSGHFSGKTMLLTSAVAFAKDGEVDWSRFGRAELDVRELQKTSSNPILMRSGPRSAIRLAYSEWRGAGSSSSSRSWAGTSQFWVCR